MKHYFILLTLITISFGTSAATKKEAILDAIWAIDRAYEHDRAQLNAAITFKGREELLLKEYNSLKEIDKPYSSITYLAAINCSFEPSVYSMYQLLYLYRCGSWDFNMFSKMAMPGNYPFLRFVKKEDIPIAIAFLKNYTEFWEKQNCKKSICIPKASIQQMHSIIKYLEEGGY